MNRGPTTDVRLLGDCRDRVYENESCICELQYELDHRLVDHRPEHERWLFDWCLECQDLESVEGITIDRRETRGKTRMTVQIELTEPCSVTFQVDGFGPLLEKLEQWIGEFTLHCETPRNHRAGT